MDEKLALVYRYFQLLENFSTDPDEFAGIFHPDIIQTAYPNQLSNDIKQRNFDNMLESMTTNKLMLKSQQFSVQKALQTGQTLVVEARWTGEIRVDAGRFRRGQIMKAFICTIIEFRDGKIYRQRNYDCYEP
ncbi:nuclear transport factor 2 family protein [Chitinophaga nivalis]|uniref:Nuclear transport factor 2 family protein n=1 Tax=Chitinophaga nivalis TaxID=2991709 RepID=A0ABT3IUT3_9BACT|nr:nuclear transport factor 2 family protein [Chitinophaga nivalis]MCW3462552.1 nuclear transport factor 2 family protein [Chitinophaga nivalis]MCW3487757.1 nuclear transport factor 2 family protein [Chitinophaga nivalis]